MPSMTLPRAVFRARVACDSLVALAPATADGSTLFAKNSDRPAMECQPLVQLPAQTWGTGATVRCTYIDIPQVSRTARVIGSRPFWCWGFEHGLNEHGVVIGNHTVFTRDPLPGKGLIGMDLVRLGLERSSTAEEAVQVMTSLLQRHGQGGSGYSDKEWPYHNSFLLADRNGAVALETSDRNWALRKVSSVASLSNHLTIGNDWDTLSEGLIEHALEQGWWSPESEERFDFARAYRDSTLVPDVISSGRHGRTCSLLSEMEGSASVTRLRQALRDHYGTATPPAGVTPEDPRYFSVCMHAEPVGTTTASMIVHLPAGQGPVTYWASLASPCVGAFLPLYVDAEIPADFARGGVDPSDDSPWWDCKQLLQLVARDWERNQPRVRAAMDVFEAELADRAEAMTRRPAQEKTVFMQKALDAFRERVNQLRDELTP